MHRNWIGERSAAEILASNDCEIVNKESGEKYSRLWMVEEIQLG